MLFLTSLLLSMFITITLIPILKGAAGRIHLMDVPNERKMHARPMPKVGGIAMAIGMLVPVVLWLESTLFIRSLLAGSALIVLVGILDDVKELGYRIKLAGQIGAAAIVVFYGGVQIQSLGNLLPFNLVEYPWFSIPLTMIAIVGVTNAINLSDGLDGLAGGLSILCFICIGYLAYCTENMSVTIICIALVGSIFGFLRFNTYPASIFMGDAGSQLLGFLAITLSLSITQNDAPYSPLMPLLLLGFPIVDTLSVMAERLAGGRSPFVADKNHFHHKLMRLGLFHTEAVFVIYVLQSILVSSAYLFRFYSEWILLLLYLLFSGLVVIGFLAADRTGWRINRSGFLDVAVKGKLKTLKDRQLPIKISFRTLKYGLPLLLFFTILVPDRMPDYFVYISLTMGLLVLWSRLFVSGTWMGSAVRIGLYMVIPFLAYLSYRYKSPWMEPNAELLFNLSFVVMAGVMILTLKFTRRTKGFKATPMDFLILFIALVLPALPGTQVLSHSFGLIAVRVIVFLFGYEVLLGELRGEFDGIGLATIVSLLVLFVRGLHMNM